MRRAGPSCDGRAHCAASGITRVAGMSAAALSIIRDCRARHICARRTRAATGNGRGHQAWTVIVNLDIWQEIDRTVRRHERAVRPVPNPGMLPLPLPISMLLAPYIRMGAPGIAG